MILIAREPIKGVADLRGLKAAYHRSTEGCFDEKGTEADYM